MTENDPGLTAVLLHRELRISLTDLASGSGLSVREIRELVELGALVPAQQDPGEWLFSAECLVQARSAARLKRDFDLNPAGLALALTYLERIRELEARLRRLECRLMR